MKACLALIYPKYCIFAAFGVRVFVEANNYCPTPNQYGPCRSIHVELLLSLTELVSAASWWKVRPSCSSPSQQTVRPSRVPCGIIFSFPFPFPFLFPVPAPVPFPVPCFSSCPCLLGRPLSRAASRHRYSLCTGLSGCLFRQLVL